MDDKKGKLVGKLQASIISKINLKANWYFKLILYQAILINLGGYFHV